MKINTLLGRITVLFFVLLIPWSCVSFSMIQSSIHNAETATEEKLLQSRGNAITAFENRIFDTINAVNLSKALERSVTLSTLYPFLSDYERLQHVRQIQESLALIKVMGQFFSNVRIYLLPIGRIYNADNYALGSVQTLDEETEKRITDLAENKISLINDEGRTILLMTNSPANPICILEVDFSMQQMQYYLANSVQDKAASQFVMQFGSENTIIENILDPKLSEAAKDAMSANKANSLTRIEHAGTKYLLYSYQSSTLNFSYCELIPIDRIFASTQLTKTLIVVFSMLTALIVSLFFVSAIRLIHRPMKGLTLGFEKLGAGEFGTRVDAHGTDDFAYLYHSFNRMADEMETLVTQNYQKNLLLQKAELRQLQSQINPHFLYNSFFLLQRVIESGDTDEACAIAQDLGLYFRYITKQNSDTVRLIDEDQHARIYANMQARRFSSRIQIDFSLPPEAYHNLQVPKLFLQPIIENAFKYALENRLTGGILRVYYKQETDKQLCIYLEDNGENCSDAQLASLQVLVQKASSQVDVDHLSGLMNIVRRLKLYYHAEDCIEVSRSELGGICIVVKLYIQ